MTAATPSATVPKSFLSALGERLGLGFAMQRYAAAEPAIREKMRRSGRRPDAFLAALERDPKLLQDAIEAVVVPETHFFRHPQHFAFLRDEVVPRLARSDGPLRIWSAGCSTGEEAYSLAIMLHQLGLSSRAEIRATDISRAALEKAQKAVYRPWSLRGVEEWPGASRYFQKLANGEYRLAREVANLVTFRQLNLACPVGIGPGPTAASMDIVLCRNVLIYMTTEAAAGIVRRLLETLLPGGWLIPGPSDPVTCRNLGQPAVTPHGIFYQRAERAETTAVTGAGPLQRANARSDALHRPVHLSGRERRAAARFTAVPPPHRDDATATPRKVATDVVPTRAGPRRPTLGKPVGQQELPQGTAEEVGRLVNAGRIEEASSLAQTAVEREPLRPAGHYVMAFVHWHRGHPEAALASVGKAIYLDPDCAVAHQMQGLLLAEQGRAEQARLAFLTAYRLASRLPGDAAVELGGCATAAQLARAARLQLRSLRGAGRVA